MFTRICLSLTLFAAMPVWSQVNPNSTAPAADPDSEERMQTPPPVSGEAYPIAVGSEKRSNYLYAGIIVNTAYDDNVLASTGTKPVSDTSYSIRPTITLDVPSTPDVDI
jgi:hypothetical protein